MFHDVRKQESNRLLSDTNEESWRREDDKTRKGAGSSLCDCFFKEELEKDSGNELAMIKKERTIISFDLEGT
jgi:hypothetical protein